jgi:RNA polymerase sigma factor (TIGR02999 family)
MHEITRILSAVQNGDPVAPRELLPLVYEELRKLAAHRLAHEKPGQTLQATALVHEAYLRLVDAEAVPHWNGRGHFFGAAAEAMRRILVENARSRGRLKRGGDGGDGNGWQRVELSSVEPEASCLADDVLALHEAMEKLERVHPRKAELVKLRFFAGLTNEQAAQVLGISTSTADNDWAYARCWLRLEISGKSAGQPGTG